MSEKEKIKKFLNSLESTSKQISEHEIFVRIKNFMKEEYEQPPEVLLWEQIAFTEHPNIQKITPEIISYWEKRSRESAHPIFKARYSNLVWDFSEKVKGEKPHYTIAQIFVDCVIEIAEKDLHRNPIDVIKKLKYALSLALSINDKARIKKLAETIISYEEKIAEDEKPGLWGFSYEFLVRNKKVRLDKEVEQKIVRDLEERFERLIKGKDHWAAKRAALLLVDYFKNKDSSKTKEILIKLGSMIQKQVNQVPSLVSSAWLEELYHLYRQHGLKEEGDKILIKIKELSKKSLLELKEIETSIKIPSEEVEKFINNLIQEDLETALQKVAFSYIPEKDKVEEQLKDISKKAPVSFLFSQKIINNEGRTIASVGPLEEDIKGHMILQISQNMQFESPLLRWTIDKLISKFNLNAEKLVNYLYKSPIFDEKRRGFFIKGIEAYLDKQHLVALHILIPQIEAIIRNLAEMIGLPVLKPSHSGGFNYRTLDELLRDEKIIAVLTEDVCLYFRVLLTDPRGWNLRNNICHGISRIEDFSQITADRVFHALLCLSLVKEKKTTVERS